MEAMKDFKVAQIVPVSCLDMIEQNHYHMCLAHLVLQDEKYAAFYRRMSDEGKFVLMDNGAAEDSQLSFNDLLHAYDIIHPTEIVVPDTLCDMDSTLAKLDMFIEKYSNLPYRFMAVPQGKTFDQWCVCAAEILRRNQKWHRISSIGVSKFLNIVTNDCMVRMGAANYVYEVCDGMFGGNTEIHLLGCHEGPGIVKEIQLEVPTVRGCDSAFAYIATQAGDTIGVNSVRPAGEINFLEGDRYEHLRENMAAFERAAGVEDNRRPDLWR